MEKVKMMSNYFGNVNIYKDPMTFYIPGDPLFAFISFADIILIA